MNENDKIRMTLEKKVETTSDVSIKNRLNMSGNITQTHSIDRIQQRRNITNTKTLQIPTDEDESQNVEGEAEIREDSVEEPEQKNQNQGTINSPQKNNSAPAQRPNNPLNRRNNLSNPRNNDSSPIRKHNTGLLGNKNNNKPKDILNGQDSAQNMPQPKKITKPTTENKAPSKAATAVEKGKDIAKKAYKAKKAVKVVKTIISILTSKITIIILLIVLIISFILAIINSIFHFYRNNNTVAMDGYYSQKCNEVTVMYASENSSGEYEITGSGTFSYSDYIAGVVSAEVGSFNNLEVFKTFAIAARSYAENNFSGSCTIEGSPRKQAFNRNISRNNSAYSLIYQAVDETEGMVVLDKAGNVKSTMYDALAVKEHDANYYTLKQANQKIPTSWIESHISASSLKFYETANHGQGLSQWGSLYLATEENKNYAQIIGFYLGNEYTISVKSYTDVEFLSRANLDIKVTTNSNPLQGQSLSDYLRQHGSSIDQLNNFIHKNVETVGVGTREGVVTAAISLINYLYDNYKIRIPYYWGGEYQNVGVNGSWGTRTSGVTSTYGTTFYYKGMDCSGFVSWAIKNGGYNMDRKTTSGFHSAFSANSCNIADKSCIGQPGDLINSRSSHVQMIVAVDNTSGKYLVAESTGSYGVIVREWNMHAGNTNSSQTLILHMDSFYNNKGNVNTAY